MSTLRMVSYYTKNLKDGNRNTQRISRNTIMLKEDPDRTILSVVYCVGERFIPVKFSQDIYIYDNHVPFDGASPNLSPLPTPKQMPENEMIPSTMAQLALNPPSNERPRTPSHSHERKPTKSRKTPMFGEKALYELTWWNGKGKHECNTIAITNKTALLDKPDLDQDKFDLKEKYYMRINTEMVDADLGDVQWHWFVICIICAFYRLHL